MSKTMFVRVRRDGAFVERYIDTFEHECPIEDIIACAKDAVKEYLNTSAGQNEVASNHGDFNWGDAIMMIPNQIWEKHGLRLLAESPKIIEVDQDENLALIRE